MFVRTTTTQDLTMSLDLYTRYIPLTQKAQFWGNYVSALKGWIVYIHLHYIYVLLMIIYQVTLTCALPLSPASPTTTPPSPRPCLQSTLALVMSLASWRAWCGEDVGVHLPLQHLFCQRLMIGSIPLATATCLCTLRYMAHTGTGMLGEDSTNFCNRGNYYVHNILIYLVVRN